MECVVYFGDFDWHIKTHCTRFVDVGISKSVCECAVYANEIWKKLFKGTYGSGKGDDKR